MSVSEACSYIKMRTIENIPQSRDTISPPANCYLYGVSLVGQALPRVLHHEIGGP